MPLAGKELGKFRRRLLAWFERQQRDLPWRRTKDSYRIWLSEIMLQQTRVAAVIPYFERFVQRFPDVRALAEAPEEEVLRQWAGLGYYSRARNLRRAAQEIVARCDGEFPRQWETALALPGIGHYTAAAILSIAYGERRAVLDGNVARVLARIEAVRGDLREPRRWRALQTSADRLLDRKNPGDWNQAMMELGATVCTPRAPMCLLCPVSQFCRARALGLTEDLPEKRRKREPVRLLLAAAVFLDARGRTLLLPPPPAGASKEEVERLSPLFSGMWHFPVVQVRRDPATELRSHLREFFGRAAIAQAEFAARNTVHHAVTYRQIAVTPFLVRVKRLPRTQRGRAVLLVELQTLPVSSLTRKIALSAAPEHRASKHAGRH